MHASLARPRLGAGPSRGGRRGVHTRSPTKGGYGTHSAAPDRALSVTPYPCACAVASWARLCMLSGLDFRSPFWRVVTAIRS